MSRVESFNPQAGASPKVLVLGSMPGIASLQAVQYYAHPRNAFWPIMADYFRFDSDQSYSRRLQWLCDHQVALWDVLQSCIRPGSLDSAIDRESIVPNPVDEWLAQQPSVQMILLNGNKAATEFRRHFKSLQQSDRLIIEALPSTSPAYAAMPFTEKKQRWHGALDRVFQSSGQVET